MRQAFRDIATTRRSQRLTQTRILEELTYYAKFSIEVVMAAVQNFNEQEYLKRGDTKCHEKYLRGFLRNVERAEVKRLKNVRPEDIVCLGPKMEKRVEHFIETWNSAEDLPPIVMLTDSQKTRLAQLLRDRTFRTNYKGMLATLQRNDYLMGRHEFPDGGNSKKVDINWLLFGKSKEAGTDNWVDLLNGTHGQLRSAEDLKLKLVVIDLSDEE